VAVEVWSAKNIVSASSGNVVTATMTNLSNMVGWNIWAFELKPASGHIVFDRSTSAQWGSPNGGTCSSPGIGAECSGGDLTSNIAGTTTTNYANEFAFGYCSVNQGTCPTVTTAGWTSAPLNGETYFDTHSDAAYEILTSEGPVSVGFSTGGGVDEWLGLLVTYGSTNDGLVAPTVGITANPTSITSGNPSTLTVTATNASTVTVGSVTLGDAGGTVVVSPIVTTTYTATATGAGGTATSSATVTVTSAQPPPVNSLAKPVGFTDTVSGTTVTLTWASDGNPNVAVCGTTHISCINSLLLQNLLDRSSITIYSCSGAACLSLNEYSIKRVARGTHTYALTVSGYNSKGAAITSPEATVEATVEAVTK